MQLTSLSFLTNEELLNKAFAELTNDDELALELAVRLVRTLDALDDYEPGAEADVSEADIEALRDSMGALA